MFSGFGKHFQFDSVYLRLTGIDYEFDTTYRSIARNMHIIPEHLEIGGIQGQSIIKPVGFSSHLKTGYGIRCKSRWYGCPCCCCQGRVVNPALAVTGGRPEVVHHIVVMLVTCARIPGEIIFFNTGINTGKRYNLDRTAQGRRRNSLCAKTPG